MGEYIRNERHKRGLLQKDIAQILKVSISTIEHWDPNVSQPQLKFYPSIIQFLGVTPGFCKDIPQLTNEVFLKRIELGLSQKRMAKRIGIDTSTLKTLERNERPMIQRTFESLRDIN
jgi:transcriptional regulator with XRE-family HTH domain